MFGIYRTMEPITIKPKPLTEAEKLVKLCVEKRYKIEKKWIHKTLKAIRKAAKSGAMSLKLELSEFTLINDVVVEYLKSEGFAVPHYNRDALEINVQWLNNWPPK